MNYTVNILERLPVLRSPRFWGIVVIGILEAIQDSGLFSVELISQLITTAQLITGTAVTIRTLDRAAEKLGQ